MNEKEAWPVGVFTSIDSGLGVQLNVAHELGIRTIQLHTPSLEGRTPQAADEFIQKIDSLGIQLTCVFAGFEGESYADIPTVEQTVGLVPSETRAARLQESRDISDFARLLGCDAVGMHLGLVPHDRNSKAYGETVQVTRQLCDHAGANEQAIHLETGQETAESLLQFLSDVQKPNLFINFDPANMIMYGTGEPIEALKLVGKYVRSVHCKDAKWSDQPSVTWGSEVPLGQGDVNIEDYLKMLLEIGYRGPLTIEREIPQDPDRQKSEVAHAYQLLEGLKSKLLAS